MFKIKTKKNKDIVEILAMNEDPGYATFIEKETIFMRPTIDIDLSNQSPTKFNGPKYLGQKTS